jgi:VanZ family protein
MTPTRVVLMPRHYAVLLAAFTAFVLYGSFVPFTTQPYSFDAAVEKFSIRMSRAVSFESRSDWAANVILFVPLGFLVAGAVTVDRRRAVAALATIPAMTALSAAIEFIQIWFPARTTSVNDVAAETLGGAVGVAAWLVVGQQVTDRVRSAWSGLGPGEWAARALPFYILFLVIAHGMPFDLTLSPYQILHKYKSGLEIDAPPGGAFVRWFPHPSILAEKTLLHVVYFLPVGALLAHLPGDRWRQPRALGRVFGSGLLIAAGVEAVQLIVLSAGTYASDVLLGAVLIVAGWKLAAWPRPFSSLQWTVGLVGWVVALLLVYWAPFDVSPDRFGERLARGEWLPFADYYSGNYLGAFNRILEKALVFIPVGFLATRAWPDVLSRSERRLSLFAPRKSALVGAGLAGVIELGQALMTEHSATTSDVILGAVGAGFGGLIALRLATAREPGPNVADRPAASRFFY